MKLSRFALRLLPALVLGCGVASANAIINVTGVDGTRGGGMIINADGADLSVYFAGVISISLTAGGQTFNRDSLCVDLFTDIYIGRNYDTNLLRPEDVSGKNLQRVSWLVDNALLPTQTSTVVSALAPSDWVTSLDPAELIAKGKGIQFAIWDIVHDGADGFSSGRVQAAAATEATVLTWAQRYEDASLGKSSNQAYVYNNVALGGTTLAQMLIGPQFADSGPQPVPEPGTLMSMGMALIAISLGLKWRHGKHS